MDTNAVNNWRSSNNASYLSYIGVVATVLQTVVKITGIAEENDIRIRIGLAALVLNLAVASLRAISQTDDRPHLPISIPELGSQTGDMIHNDWKPIISKVIFGFTGLLALYLPFSVLLREWWAWFVFVIACIIVSIVDGDEMLRTMFTWSYGAFVSAVIYVIEKLKEWISEPQIEPTV